MMPDRRPSRFDPRPGPGKALHSPSWRNRGVLAAVTAHLLGVVSVAVVAPEGRWREAYIDPGSGSLLLQIVVSFFVGLLFYLRTVRRFFVGLFTRWVRRDPIEKTDSRP